MGFLIPTYSRNADTCQNNMQHVKSGNRVNDRINKQHMISVVVGSNPWAKKIVKLDHFHNSKAENKKNFETTTYSFSTTRSFIDLLCNWTSVRFSRPWRSTPISRKQIIKQIKTQYFKYLNSKSNLRTAASQLFQC